MHHCGRFHDDCLNHYQDMAIFQFVQNGGLLDIITFAPEQLFNMFYCTVLNGVS